jgi:hypothetical protein
VTRGRELSAVLTEGHELTSAVSRKERREELESSGNVCDRESYIALECCDLGVSSGVWGGEVMDCCDSEIQSTD